MGRKQSGYILLALWGWPKLGDRGKGNKIPAILGSPRHEGIKNGYMTCVFCKQGGNKVQRFCTTFCFTSPLLGLRHIKCYVAVLSRPLSLTIIILTSLAVFFPLWGTRRQYGSYSQFSSHYHRDPKMARPIHAMLFPPHYGHPKTAAMGTPRRQGLCGHVLPPPPIIRTLSDILLSPPWGP